MSGGFRSNLAWTILGIPLGVGTLLYSLFGRRKKVDLQDKVVLLTGASGGLGEALAEVFYDAGCKLILSGRQTKSLEKVRDRLSSKMKTNCHVPAMVIMDLADKTNIPEKINEAIAAFGHIDILVSNAGISSRGWVHQTLLDVDEKLLNVNYLGQIRVAKALLPHMTERKSGHFVVVSSVQGKISIPGRAPYAASKHALEGFFDTLRAELSLYNVGVTTICAFYVKTNFSVNAITADGSPYDLMDNNTATGLDPVYVARKILQSVVYRKEEIQIAPLYVQLATCLRAMAPWLLFKLMARKAKRESALLPKKICNGTEKH